MVLTLAVGDNDYLLGHIDEVDEVPVYDETLSYTDEWSLVLPKLLANHIFELSELIGNLAVAAVLCVDLGIVAVRCDEHQPI